jgi:AcrR family transcriptional regulator
LVARSVTPRPLTAKGRATRERIIRHASDLFTENGYAAVSVREIADRSGVSTGAIYSTFKGKADLLAEAVSASLAADLEIIDPDLIGLSLPEIVGRQFARLDDSGRRRLRLLLMSAASAAGRDPEVRERLEPLLRERLRTWSAHYVDWQVTSNVSSGLDMLTLVHLLIAADLGLSVFDELGVGLPDGGRSAILMEAMLTALQR